MNTIILAHAGESHESTVESINHSLAWYVSFPLFLLFLAAVGYIIWLVSGKKFGVVLFSEAVLLLISGFTLFNVSALISVFSITAGILIAGFFAFTSLLGSDTKK